jgi:ankyrin repeat protein
MDARKADIKAAHSQTCQWLLNHPDFLSWLDQRRQHCRFLWIRGKPGVGKSIIMKFVYTRMRKQDQARQVLTTSFFFNARGDVMEKSVSGMYRSLLLQLLEGFPDLQGVLDDHDLVPRNHKTCPSLNSLKDLFRAAILCLGNRSCACFIDALDECDEQQIRDMIEFFEELSEYCRGEGIKLRVCFSSRHYPYITIRSGIQLTLEGQPGHNKDMESYIENHLRVENPILFDSLKSTMLDKAAGIFLWVALVVQILNADHRRGNPGLQKRLMELPSGLSDLFKDVLTRDQENMEELRLSIIWILFAQRPLEPEEYYHALWSDLSPDDLASLERRKVKVSEASGLFERYVTSSSKGLAETTQSKKPTVQFIHESVRDFLIRDKGLHELWPDLEQDWESQSHDRLKSCCNTYILRQQAERPKCTSNSRKYIVRKYPLLEYASLSVLNHANAAADAIPQRRFLDDFHTPGWIHSFNTVERVSTRRYNQDVDILYILADRGLSSLIRARLIDHPNINIEGGKFRYPFLAAIARRDKASIVALLGVSSEIYDGAAILDNLDCKLETLGHNHTPLSWACEKGNLTIAKLLSQKGVHIGETSGESRRCLVGAMDNGHVEVVKWLIDQGAPIETKDSLGHTPLYWSSARGDVYMSQKLLDRGAKLDLNGTDQSLLLGIVKGGRKDTLQLLLNKGMEIESRDESGRTPLMLAVERRYAAMVQLLLERGAEVEAMDYSNRTALSYAFCGQADEVILRLLLEGGANTEVNDDDGRPFLCLAARQGNTAAVRLLLEHGANIESKDHWGMTALSHAVGVGEHGSEDIVRLLLEHGADVEARIRVDGLMPLEEAVRQGNTAVVQLLLDNGMMINATNGRFGTPLAIASGKRDMPMVQLLLEKGACINTSDRYSDRPLFRAVYGGHEDIVRLLINGGAVVSLDGEEREAMEEAFLGKRIWWFDANHFGMGEDEKKVREKELRLRRLVYPQLYGDIPGSTGQT